ncbi:MAG TPA: sigma-70 family RNA polymerase sigma factor [Candidatus Sulfotelmatobacter sp.]
MPWDLPIFASDLDLFKDDLFKDDRFKDDRFRDDLFGRRRDESARAVMGNANTDEAAFGAFYEETCRPLFGYLLRVSGERALAEDLLQEAYCRLLTADLPPMDRSQSRSYLFRTASNLLRDRWRSRKESPLPEDVPEVAASAPHPDVKLEMRQALQQLKPRERELLWLAYVEGSNHKEIADCTGLRAGSIRLLLFRARRKLANLMGGGR